MQPSVPTLVLARRRLPGSPGGPRAPPRRRRGRDAARDTSSRIGSPSRTSASGPPTADSGATCRTTAPYDVPLMRASEIRRRSLTPCSQQLRGYGQVAPLGHARGTDRAGVAEHHDAGLRRTPARGRRPARRGRGCPRTRSPRPSCCEERGSAAVIFITAPSGQRLPRSTTSAPPSSSGLRGRPDHIAVDDLRTRDVLADGAAGDRDGIEVEQVGDLRHHGRHPARVEEVLHQESGPPASDRRATASRRTGRRTAGAAARRRPAPRRRAGGGSRSSSPRSRAARGSRSRTPPA